MDSSGPSSSNAVNEAGGGSQQYNPHTSQVPISNFVSIKLSGETDYLLRKEQMTCLLEYHDMVGFINGSIENPRTSKTPDTNKNTNSEEKIKDEKYSEWKKWDTLVKGWIYATLSQDVIRTVLGLGDAYKVWDKLKNTYDKPLAEVLGAEGSHQHNPHPSQVPISNFVSIKLSGETNYNLWKKQMVCLLEYHDMVDYIDGTIRNPMDDDDTDSDDDDDDDDGNKVEMSTCKFKEWNKWKDTLVKGWIFGTLSERVLGTVLDLHNAYSVWEELKNSYDHSLRVEGAEFFTLEEISRSEKENVVEANYIPLHRAIMRGDWDKAQEFFKKDKATLTAKIDGNGSALHLAVFSRQNLQIVENLLKEIPSESLPTLVTNNGFTTLHLAARAGNTKAAKMLVEKNPSLLFMTDPDYSLPVRTALVNYHEETFLYLLEASKLRRSLSQHDSYQNPFEGTHGYWLFYHVINHGYLDIAYELLCKYPNLAISEDLTKTPLRFIVNNQDLYFSATRYNFYQRFIYSNVPIGENISDNDNMNPDIENPGTCSTKFVTMCKWSCFYPVIKRIYDNSWKAALLHVPYIKHLQEEKLNHKKALMILGHICEEIGKINDIAKIYNQYCGAFNSAVLKDNREAVEIIIRFFPQAIWSTNDHYLISQVAAKNRCEMVLNFLEDQACGGINLFSISPDKEGNYILHLAGQLAPIEKLNMVSGAALQIQREVRWFKKIEKCVLPSENELKNLKRQTPIMVFREEHKQLRKEGEEWIKKTSDSYTITAALIITIVFAAAITVPGGNDQNTGKPIYKTHASFIVFAISDAISLFTSTTSLLLFLSILTARYHEDDFLYKLPKRLILGLMMLFLSVTSMMVAFGATLYIMFGQGKEWILIPITTLACLPIASYVILQYPLLHELVSSTYGHGIYIKKNDRKNK